MQRQILCNNFLKLKKSYIFYAFQSTAPELPNIYLIIRQKSNHWVLSGLGNLRQLRSLSLLKSELEKFYVYYIIKGNDNFQKSKRIKSACVWRKLPFKSALKGDMVFLFEQFIVWYLAR